MSKEEAIKTLQTRSCYECSYGCDSADSCENEDCYLREATLMAIEALKADVGELKLISDDREAADVLITWLEDGTYTLQIKSPSYKTITMTTEGVIVEE